MRLPVGLPEPPAAHLDRRQPARVPREDRLNVRLVEALRQHGDVGDNLHLARDEFLELAVLVAFGRHDLARHPAVRQYLLELAALHHRREERQRLAPLLRRVQVAFPDDLRTVVRQQIGMERAQVPFADEAVYGTGSNRFLERQLHPVRPKRRGGQSKYALALHLLVQEHARLRGLVVRFVKNDEIGLGRRLLEERHRTDVVLMEVAVSLHHLAEQMTARRDPIDLELAPEELLQSVDRLERHICLAGADGRLQHHGRAAASREPRETRRYRLLLVLPDFPVHPRALSPKSIPRR